MGEEGKGLTFFGAGAFDLVDIGPSERRRVAPAPVPDWEAIAHTLAEALVRVLPFADSADVSDQWRSWWSKSTETARAALALYDQITTEEGT